MDALAKVGFGVVSLLYLLFLLRLAWADFRTGYLRDRLTLPLLALGLLFSALGLLGPLGASLWGAALGGGLLYALLRLSGGGLGGGDVKLAAAIGAWTGAPNVVVALFVAFLCGGLWGLMLLLRGHGRKARLPFGPALALGGLLGFACGDELWAFYGTFF